MIMKIEKSMLVLASSSERRKIILAEAGVFYFAAEHRIGKEPEFCEKENGASVEDFIKELAFLKAESIAEEFPENFILGSDTLVYLNGKVYGKPVDTEDAFLMIKELSGKIHVVYSGAALINKSRGIAEKLYDRTSVTLKKMDDMEIKEYVRKFNPTDKAGGYGIQDENGIVESFKGSFENVMGLPIQKLEPVFKTHGIFTSGKSI